MSQQQREQIKRDLQLLKGDDDRYVLSTLASMYGLPKLVEYISGRLSQARTDAIGECQRVAGMLLENVYTDLPEDKSTAEFDTPAEAELENAVVSALHQGRVSGRNLLRTQLHAEFQHLTDRSEG